MNAAAIILSMLGEGAKGYADYGMKKVLAEQEDERLRRRQAEDDDRSLERAKSMYRYQQGLDMTPEDKKAMIDWNRQLAVARHVTSGGRGGGTGKAPAKDMLTYVMKNLSPGQELEAWAAMADPELKKAVAEAQGISADQAGPVRPIESMKPEEGMPILGKYIMAQRAAAKDGGLNPDVINRLVGNDSSGGGVIPTAQAGEPKTSGITQTENGIAYDGNVFESPEDIEASDLPPEIKIQLLTLLANMGK